MKRLMAAPCILLGLTFGLTALPSSAFAASGNIPPGGGWNMLHDPTMFTGAMAHDSANGNAGMCRAVLQSSGTGC